MSSMLLRRSSAPFHKLKGGSFKGRSFVAVANDKWPYGACTALLPQRNMLISL